MPWPPLAPMHDAWPQPMIVKLATSGIVNGAGIEAEVAARSVAAVVLDAFEVDRVEAGAGARRELHRALRHDELNAAREALGHVEHVVRRLERDEVVDVESAAEELERVIESVERLEIRGARARSRSRRR